MLLTDHLSSIYRREGGREEGGREGGRERGRERGGREGGRERERVTERREGIGRDLPTCKCRMFQSHLHVLHVYLCDITAGSESS